MAKNGSSVGSRTTIYVWGVVAICVLAVGFVLGVVFLRPEKDNTALIATVFGVLVPVIAALLAAAVQQVHLAVNSRLSQLLELTAKASKAEGKLEDKQ